MKGMDEMDRHIQLRSEELGYKTALLSLSAWTVYNVCQALKNGTKLNILPCLILCLSACVQGFSQIAMRQKMVAGDEEYKEPNRLVQTIAAGIVMLAIILSVGTYFLLKA